MPVEAVSGASLSHVEEKNEEYSVPYSKQGSTEILKKSQQYSSVHESEASNTPVDIP